jgi:hypothetical protein
MQNYINPNVRASGQGKAMQRKKSKRPKLGGGQANDRSGD